MSMAKRLNARRSGKRGRHSDRLLGYHRGGRVTWSVDREGYTWIVVRWPTGSSWTIGPCTPLRDAGSWLRNRRVELMSFLKKLDHVAGVGPHELYIADGMLIQMPAIMEYLAIEQYEDGTKRERSSLLVIIESGLVKVCLSDRANNRTLWRSSPSIEDCLMNIETALQSDTADWRRSAAKTVYGGKPKRS